jgi:RNA 3'-terminal phosphate cyclase (ATP)
MAVGTSLVTIDGAYGEGGGALLRSALAMSAMTQQPVRVLNVRAGTNYSGLDPEDLTLIQILAESCNAETSGATLGSESFSFAPTRRPKGVSGSLESVRNGSSRGANALVVLNSLLPVLAQSGVYSTVQIRGETHGMNALSYEAFAYGTLRALKGMGLYAYPTLLSAGFGRESDGEVALDVEPSHLDGIDWTDRGQLTEFRAIVTTCGLSSSIAARALSHIHSMANQAGVSIIEQHVEAEGAVPGCYVTVCIGCERGGGGGSAMGTRGVRVESLAQAAFDEALTWLKSGCSVDPYLADQILLTCVFAEGPSTFKVSRLTQRLLTSVWVVKQFTPIHITVRGSENHSGTVTIRH